jgi:hypothetical protein
MPTFAKALILIFKSEARTTGDPTSTNSAAEWQLGVFVSAADQQRHGHQLQNACITLYSRLQRS